MDKTLLTAAELAAQLGGELYGDPALVVEGVSSPADAVAGQLIYASNPRSFMEALQSKASLILSDKRYSQEAANVIIVNDPRAAYIYSLSLFKKTKIYSSEVADSAIIALDALLAGDVTIMAGAVVGAGVSVGAGSVIGVGAVLGDGVVVGKNCILHARVVLGDETQLGDNVIIHAGAVIGSDGFGYQQNSSGEREKIPQIGRVVIEDNVEIGANSTIDRATAGVTLIGKGTKIDNLVHIAHNCRIGSNNVIAAQVGIAGSVETGEGSVFAGQAGVTDHCKIGSNVFVGGKSGVISPRLRSNTAYWGNPAREMSRMKKMLAALLRLSAKK